MADALTTITKLMQSPPGQLAAGGVLAGIVWKFFERVEAVLADRTKLEIAVWLLGVRVADRVPWPETFSKVFDRVFGEKHLSWRCFSRCCIGTLTFYLIGAIFMVLFGAYRPSVTTARYLGLQVMPLVIVFVGIPLDYLSMGNTRYVLRLAAKKSSYKTLLLCIFMSLAVFVIAHIALAVGSAMTFSFGGGIPIIISSPSSVVSHKFVE